MGRHSTSLYYISLSLGFGNIDDCHPNIDIREIICLGDKDHLHSVIQWSIDRREAGNTFA